MATFTNTFLNPLGSKLVSSIRSNEQHTMSEASKDVATTLETTTNPAESRSTNEETFGVEGEGFQDVDDEDKKAGKGINLSLIEKYHKHGNEENVWAIQDFVSRESFPIQFFPEEITVKRKQETKSDDDSASGSVFGTNIHTKGAKPLKVEMTLLYKSIPRPKNRSLLGRSWRNLPQKACEWFEKRTLPLTPYQGENASFEFKGKDDAKKTINTASLPRIIKIILPRTTKVLEGEKNVVKEKDSKEILNQSKNVSVSFDRFNRFYGMVDSINETRRNFGENNETMEADIQLSLTEVSNRHLTKYGKLLVGAKGRGEALARSRFYKGTEVSHSVKDIQHTLRPLNEPDQSSADNSPDFPLLTGFQ